MDALLKSVENIKFPSNIDQFVNSNTESKVVTVGAAGVSLVLASKLINKVYGTDPIGRTLEFFSFFATQEKTRQINVNEMIDGYNNLHDDSLESRNSAYSTLVNSYYELATSFYEWGWGQSFHFATKVGSESFAESIRRHEYHLAAKLGAKAGDKILDCGCGVGGPMRNIAKFLRANITGVTLSSYQVIRGNQLNQKAGLLGNDSVHQGSALSVECDFTKLTEKFEENSFDGCYAIEATCHAPSRHAVYGEINKVLKPGKVFACLEWCLTPKYDPSNEQHVLIKKKIEEGDGLPDMATQEEVVKALEESGFEIIEYRDMALDDTLGGEKWYAPLAPSWNPLTFNFQLNPLGMFLTTQILKFAELIWLVPTGTSKIQTMLQQGGWGCVQGGITGTFTPMFLMVARKPLQK